MDELFFAPSTFSSSGPPAFSVLFPCFSTPSFFISLSKDLLDILPDFFSDFFGCMYDICEFFFNSFKTSFPMLYNIIRLILDIIDKFLLNFLNNRIYLINEISIEKNTITFNKSCNGVITKIIINPIQSVIFQETSLPQCSNDLC